MCIEAASSRPSPKEKATSTQPLLFREFDNKSHFENAEWRYKADVVDMKLIKEMQYRLLSFGEEEGR